MLGGSGLVGTALSGSLAPHDIRVSSYSRSHVSGDELRPFWDPASGQIDMAPLAQSGAVVNLAGEPLSPGRWTEARRQRIYDSRVGATRLLCERLAGLDRRPAVLVNASAIGYYGDRGEDAVTEDSPAGDGFLAELCQAWEAATQPARDAGIRVVHARFGIILSTRGGALAAMLPMFRRGLGGRMGSGRQFMAWITLGDAVRALRFALSTEDISGPLNLVAPEPARNAHFVRVLGRALGRPTALPAPRMALRMVLGREAADALLLTGADVRPAALEHAGFRFDSPRLSDALRTVLDNGA